MSVPKSKAYAPLALVVGAVVVTAILLLSLPGPNPLVRDDRDPVADAGPDVAVDQGDTVTLDGSGSTDDRAVTSWSWAFEHGGEPVDLEGESATFTFALAGIYGVTLTVADKAGNSASDSLVVTVRDTEPPVADAGPDVQVVAGTTVALSGTGSTDNLGVLAHRWTFEVDGSPVELQGAEVDFEFALGGTFVVTLNVSDAAGNWDVDTVAVTVEPEDPVPVRRTFVFDLDQGYMGWEPGFADYAVGDEADVMPDHGHEALPDGLGGSGVYLEGRNTPDDLFMYLKRRLSGLVADTDYWVTLEVTLASKYPEGSFGVGGSPGDSVYMKVGASGFEPDRYEDGLGDWRMTVDKGQQLVGGRHAHTTGTIAKPEDGTEDYVLLSRDNPDRAILARTDPEGDLWAFLGTDSGFEGLTRVYYTRVVVTVDPFPANLTLHYDFSVSDHGWEPGFADVDPDLADNVGFESGLRLLPAYLDHRLALWFNGSNIADDLFMFFTTSLVGLAPDTEYDVVFEVGFASMWYAGQPGAGGSPADAVWIRAGLAPEEFRVEVGHQDRLRIFPSVGNMSWYDGEAGIPLGNVAKPDDGTDDWVLLEHRSEPGSFRATTDGEGNLWALFGTDSGFEGLNQLYFTYFTIELRPVG
jgi:hypothetical protein